MFQRRGTTAEWAAANSILAAGEIGLDLTLMRIKVGDGVTAWLSLAFYAPPGHEEAADPHPQYTTAAELSAAVAAAISALVAGAPAALDTLDELAAALADDAAFSTTVLAAIGAKQIAIQFKDEGSSIGGLGAINAVDFVGADVSAAVVGTTLTITISGGGGGSGDSIVWSVTQAAHGFSVGKPVYRASGSYAQADRDAGGTMADGIVAAVADAGNFTFQQAGKLTLTTAEWDARTGDTGGLTDGQYYWLSSTVGGITKTAPTTGLRQLIGKALSTTVMEVIVGEVVDLGVGSAVASGTGGFVPTLILSGNTFSVPVNYQALFHVTIDVQGTLDVAGSLIGV